MFLERPGLVLEELETNPELLGPFSPPLPAIVGDNGPVDLHAGREVARDHLGGDALGIGAFGDRRPGKKHGGTVCGGGSGASREFALDEGGAGLSSYRFSPDTLLDMRDDYIKEALKSINDPNVLINVVSRRVKQLKRGNRPLVESLEKLSAEDTALREIIEGKISFEAENN